MKTIVVSFISALLTIFFSGCSNEFGTPEKSAPSANSGSVHVKFETNASPVLKDGEDDEEPIPMFEITGVITQNGNPVQAGLELMSMPQSILVDSTNTDSNGGFEFYNIASGSYNLVVIVGGDVADVIEVNL